MNRTCRVRESRSELYDELQVYKMALRFATEELTCKTGNAYPRDFAKEAREMLAMENRYEYLKHVMGNRYDY